jgi:hypothetical protein
MIQQSFDILAYLFTLVVTLALLGGLPVVLLSQLVNPTRTRQNPVPLIVTLSVIGGFVAGAMVGWSLLPSQWQMSFWETACASFDAEKYGHPLEHQAEQLLLFVLFIADLGAIAAGVTAGTIAGFRRRAERHA